MLIFFQVILEESGDFYAVSKMAVGKTTDSLNGSILQMLSEESDDSKKHEIVTGNTINSPDLMLPEAVSATPEVSEETCAHRHRTSVNELVIGMTVKNAVDLSASYVCEETGACYHGYNEKV